MRKKMRIYVVFALFIPALIRPVSAQDTLIVGLKQAQEIALENSQDVVLSGIEIDKAKAQVNEAMAALLPQVNGTIAYTQYGKLPSTIFPNSQAQQVNEVYSLIEHQFAEMGNPLPVSISQDPSDIPTEAALQFGKKFNVNADITATQVVFNGVFLVGLRAAAAFVSIVEHQGELSREAILDNVRRSYYQVLAARENILMYEKNIGNIEKLRDETRALFENGFAEGIDVDRLQLSLNNLQTQREQAVRQLALAEAVLKFQMGIDIYQPIRLVGRLSDYVEDTDFNIPQHGDFSNRTEVSLFNVREQVNEYNVKRYKAGYYPSMVGYATLGSSAQRDKFSFFRFNDANPWFNQRYFGFEINVPIWDSFGKRSQVQYAQLEIERIRAEREKFFHSMDLQYEQAKTSVIKAREELEFARDNIELAEKIYSVSKVKYREGVGSSIEMTNAERDLYDAQANLLMAQYNLLMALADIDKALGNYDN